MQRHRHRKCFVTALLIIYAVLSPVRNALGTPDVLPSDGTYTLAQLVEWALRHSELAASHRARAEERRHAADQARTWPNPAVDVSGGRRRTGESSGPLYELGLSQPLPLFGKEGLRGEILQLDSETWRVRQTAAKTGVALEVIRLGYEVAFQGRKAKLFEARQQRFELMRAYMAGREEFVAPQQKAESRLVEQRLRRLVSEGLQAQAALRASFEQLKIYVVFAPGHYPMIEVPWLAGTKSLDGKEWADRVTGNNPALAMQDLSVKSAGLEKTLAGREALPDLSLRAFYDEATAGETERNAGMGLSVGLPFWNRNQAGVKSADQRVIAEESLLGFQRRQVQSDLARVLTEYDSARRVVAEYPRLLLSELEAQLKETEEEFRKGRVDLLTFLEFENEVAETSQKVLDAQFVLVSKLLELLALSGERDPISQLASFEERGPAQ